MVQNTMLELVLGGASDAFVGLVPLVKDPTAFAWLEVVVSDEVFFEPELLHVGSRADRAPELVVCVHGPFVAVEVFCSFEGFGAFWAGVCFEDTLSVDFAEVSVVLAKLFELLGALVTHD